MDMDFGFDGEDLHGRQYSASHCGTHVD